MWFTWDGEPDSLLLLIEGDVAVSLAASAGINGSNGIVVVAVAVVYNDALERVQELSDTSLFLVSILSHVLPLPLLRSRPLLLLLGGRGRRHSCDGVH